MVVVFWLMTVMKKSGGTGREAAATAAAAAWTCVYPRKRGGSGRSSDVHTGGAAGVRRPRPARRTSDARTWGNSQQLPCCSTRHSCPAPASMPASKAHPL